MKLRHKNFLAPLVGRQAVPRRGAFGLSQSTLACCEMTRVPPGARLCTGPGATDNAGKVIPARCVMVPTFVRWRGESGLRWGLAGGLTEQGPPPESGSKTKLKKAIW